MLITDLLVVYYFLISLVSDRVEDVSVHIQVNVTE